MSTFCLDPNTIVNSVTRERVTVPCLKCFHCMKRKISAWSHRLLVEDRHSHCAYFVTLTYAPESIKNESVVTRRKGLEKRHDLVRRTNRGFCTLCPRDLQLFFKRLRKIVRKSGFTGTVKYYAVGEYGGRRMRPHYHIILFNARPWMVERAWQLGHVHFGSVGGASVGYTLKYVVKPSKVPLHRNDDRVPEFARMSAGLGKGYLTTNMVKWHLADPLNRMYAVVEEGVKVPLSRYYKLRLFSEDIRKQQALYFADKLGLLKAEAVKKDGGMLRYLKLNLERSENAKRIVLKNALSRDNLYQL